VGGNQIIGCYFILVSMFFLPRSIDTPEVPNHADL
jgi:hypothetical protein